MRFFDYYKIYLSLFYLFSYFPRFYYVCLKSKNNVTDNINECPRNFKYIQTA
jgi:hypothetical protein